MEFIVPKITKSRTQKRRKRLIKNRRRNQRKKLEVKASKQRNKITRDYNNISMLTQNVNFHTTMTANAFWENYKVAHDWQHRHNVAWWKSRCIALEHENRALRDKIKEQAATCNVNINNEKQSEKYLPENTQNRNHTDEDEDIYEYDAVDEENLEEDDQNLEFHVDEEMMKFLEQSIRHKMELKRIRKCEDDKLINDQKNSINIESGEAIINQRINDAKLLYGAASLRILAMETAVQASIDQHKDRAKPHYWPNIPLKS
ncbi:hypothetical protein PV327_009213 [Microctonus hyperodae]|uniref:Gem-associated protein 8 n=1 Tax=Microctonus hyperodae TaxID=165561 RepID=A0AA39KVN2_MICHY|nr:hypothetical protein PV327_009213 [Microctonus hyperodae]